MRTFRWMLRGALIVGGAVALLQTSCSGECGDGTVRYGDTCLAVDPFDKTPPVITVSPGLYTREVGTVRLETDEPATIYYTLDGTLPTLESANEADTVVLPNVPDNAQLRYFAVDINGNRSNEELRIWIIDREGPAPPADFRLTFANPSRTVEWTPPKDPRFGGVLLARVEGQLATSPISGKQYAVGDTLSPGVTVVQIDGPEVTTASTFSESITAQPGLVRYVAWGFDDLYNYGGGAGGYTVVPMPAQNASVVATASTLTISSQPANVALSGSASLNGTTLTIDLAMRNDTTRVLFAPKMVLTTALPLPGGLAWSNSDGVIGTTPYRAYGAVLPPGSTTRATWTFTGASSGTTLSLALQIKDNPVLYATYWDGDTAGPVVDQVTGAKVLQLAGQATGDGGDGMTNRGGITADGRLIVGAKTSGSVSMYDLLTGDRILTTELRAQKAQVPQVALDASGTTAYAIVANGHPNNLQNNGNGSSESELVRLDATTLTVGRRLALGDAKVRGFELSPDGKTLLIATGLVTQGVIVVDLQSFSIRSRILTDFRPQTATFVPGSIEGAAIAIVGERVALYSLDGTPAASFVSPGTNGKVVRAAFSSPTLLWIGRRNELSTINVNDGTTQTFPTSAGRTLEIFDGKIYAGTNALRRIALDGTIELDPIPGFTSIDGHWVGRSPF